MTQFYNYIVPSIQSALTVGHLPDSDLLGAIKAHKGEGYHCLFSLEKRDDYKGYQGKTTPAFGWFPLDFDCDPAATPPTSVEDAKKDCLKACAALSLTPDFTRIYFSGKKGFHLYIRQEFFGKVSTAQEFRSQVTKWKTAIGLPTLDDGIIQANRKFRLPNSLHPSSKKYKVELTFEQMQDWSIEQILAFASKPREITLEIYDVLNISAQKTDLSAEVKSSGPVALPTALPQLGSFGTENVIVEDYSNIYKEQPCVTRIWGIKDMATSGRHPYYLTLIGELHKSGASESDALARATSWCIANNLPSSRIKDLDRIVRQEYDGTTKLDYGCYSREKTTYCSRACSLFKKLTIERQALTPITEEDKLREIKEAEAATKKAQKAAARKEDNKIARKDNYIQGFPDWSGKFPQCTIENVRHLIGTLGIEVSYDMIKKDLSIQIPNSKYLIDTEKNDKLSRILSYAIKCGIPHGNVPEFVAFIASQNPINPVVRWIESSPWDGVSRVQAFYDTVVCVGNDEPSARGFKETLLKRWMISAIAAAFRPNGYAAHGVLVFAGEQYIGKTNWFKNLVPQELGFTRDGMILDPKDKDSVYQIVSNWLVELGEVDATFRKADMAQLKAFLTKDKDTLRLPYRREPASFARRTVFFASVNDSNYLSDPTGNRRFWTIECAGINHSHGLPMQQVWAEFLVMYTAGELGHLDHKEMMSLNSHNREYENESPFEDKIRAYFSFDGDLTFMTASTIAEKLGYSKPSVRDLKHIGAAIRKIFGQERKKSNGQSGYYLRNTIVEPNS